MKRREFMMPVGGAVGWPLAARAQQPGPVRHTVVLKGTAEAVSRLNELGWRESRNRWRCQGS